MNSLHALCTPKLPIPLYCHEYRDTIAGSPPGERFFFEKNKIRLSKTEFLNFYFFNKKNQ